MKPKQSRYNRGCLGPIYNMDFQFWAIWAARGSKGKKKYELLATFGGDFLMFSWAKKVILY